MSAYRIEFAPRAYRQFAKLPSGVRRRLGPHIDGLAVEPRPSGVKRLVADEELYRIRVGAYRVVYAVEEDRLVVLVVKIGHRRDTYRSDVILHDMKITLERL